MPKSRQRKTTTKPGYKPKGAVLAQRRHTSFVNRLRRQGLCTHTLDVQKYASEAEHAADETPNLVCGQCGLRIMRIGYFSPAGEVLAEERIEELFQEHKAALLVEFK